MHPLHRHRRHCIALAGAAAALWLSPALAQGKTTARKILVLGDSLSAEYGLARGTGWVTLLEQRLAKQHPHASVVNASISGETTAGGRSRLPALLKQHQPQIVVIELGGNDALRGLPLKNTEENLRLMLQVSKESGAKGLLVGMQMPPNYGASYGRDFAQIYTRVAQDTRTPAGAVLSERCGRHSQRRRAVPGRPHPPPCRSPAADAGQRRAHPPRPAGLNPAPSARTMTKAGGDVTSPPGLCPSPPRACWLRSTTHPTPHHGSFRVWWGSARSVCSRLCPVTRRCRRIARMGGIRVRMLALGLLAQFFFFFLLFGQLALSFLVSVVGCSQCVLSLSMEVVWVDIAPSCPAAGCSPS